jgi:hypothetical protein
MTFTNILPEALRKPQLLIWAPLKIFCLNQSDLLRPSLSEHKIFRGCLPLYKPEKSSLIYRRMIGYQARCGILQPYDEQF